MPCYINTLKYSGGTRLNSINLDNSVQISSNKKIEEILVSIRKDFNMKNNISKRQI